MYLCTRKRTTKKKYYGIAGVRIPLSRVYDFSTDLQQQRITTAYNKTLFYYFIQSHFTE